MGDIGDYVGQLLTKENIVKTVNFLAHEMHPATDYHRYQAARHLGLTLSKYLLLIPVLGTKAITRGGSIGATASALAAASGVSDAPILSAAFYGAVAGAITDYALNFIAYEVGPLFFKNH